MTRWSGLGIRLSMRCFPRPWAHLQRKRPHPGLVCTTRRPCRNSRPLNASWSTSGCWQCSDCWKLRPRVFRFSGIAISCSVRRETTAKTPLFFAKSTSVALRRIPNLLCLTSSMRQWLGCRQRDREAFRRAARRFRSVREIKMVTGFLVIRENRIAEKCKLVSAIFCPFLIFLMGMAMSRNLEAEEAGPLRSIQTIPLRNVEGRIDHMAVDLKGERLFIAALGNNTVEIVDLRAGKHIGTITGLHGPQGVAFVPEFNKIFIANAQSGACEVFDGSL